MATHETVNPAIAFVDRFLMELPMIPEEAVKEAIANISKVNSTYGLLWGDLTMKGRTRDTMDLKFYDAKKKVLQLILNFMNDEKVWPIITIASTGMRVKKEAED